jgi:hypothetical protein
MTYIYVLGRYLFMPMHETELSVDLYLPSGSDSRIEVCLRSLAPTAGNKRQMDWLDRLRRLEAVGALDTVTAHVWGDSISTQTPEISGLDDVLGRITDIYSFSAENEPSITPFFRVTRIDASLSGESFERIVPPQCTFMCYESDTLVGVFPCQIDERTYGPADVIERLESDLGTELVESVNRESSTN